jgi:hypothetical protein
MSSDAGGQTPNEKKTGGSQRHLRSGFDYASNQPPPDPTPVAPPNPLKSMLAALAVKLLTKTLPKLLAKFRTNPIYAIAIGGVALGILVGIFFAGVIRRMQTPGRYDLGIVSAETQGLKGHLYTEWNQNLDYHLSVEPDYSEHEDGFANAVNHSPRPLSIGIQLKNSKGQVVCSDSVLLKFDTHPVAAPPAPNADPAIAAADLAAQEAANARLDAQELERERGKHVFQNGQNRDGEVDAIHSQGEIPCSRKAYDSIVTWSLAPDFPTLAEQEDWLHPLVAPEPPKMVEVPKKLARKPVAKPFSFFVEGDDTIAGFDSSTGTIETGSGRAFLIDKTGPAAAAIKSLDYPVPIHYKCDQFNGCSIARHGAAVMMVKRRK